MFSSRTNWTLQTNLFSRTLAEVTASGTVVLDLTVSNPTAAGIVPDPGASTGTTRFLRELTVAANKGLRIFPSRRRRERRARARARIEAATAVAALPVAVAEPVVVVS